MKILITGATGFVGRPLCAELTRRGSEYRAAVRRGGILGPIDEVSVGEINESTDWRPAMQGVQVVIHLAGLAHRTRRTPADDEHFRLVNAEGTAALGKAAAAAGVERIVFLSTVKVNGDRSDNRPLTEEDPPNPDGPYARSKLAAEEALRLVSTETGIGVTIVRTPLVYGPGVRANFLALMTAVAKGIPLPLGAIRNARSLIFVGNLIDALLLCVDQPTAAGQVFFVKDGPDLSTPDLVREIARAAGRRARLIPVPVALLNGGARVVGRGDAVSRLTESLVVDDRKIRERFHWRPPFDMRHGLEQTVQWYLNH